MIKGDGITKELIEQNIGNYILLGGHGLIDGLKGANSYKEYLKIIKLEHDDDGDLEMYIKQYHNKNFKYLPEFEWNQEYIIINKKEYNKLKLKVD
jgi:hypothetical protein